MSKYDNYDTSLESSCALLLQKLNFLSQNPDIYSKKVRKKNLSKK